MVLNPVKVGGESIIIRYGLRAYLDIPFNNIESITASSALNCSKEDKKAAIAPSVDAPNLLIECKDSVEAIGMFGKKKRSHKVYLALDQADEFKREVEQMGS